MDTAELARRWRNGETLRSIAATEGVSHVAILGRLRRAYRERFLNAIGSHSIMIRITNSSGRAYRAAETVLALRRPRLHARLMRRSRPRTCQRCSSAVKAYRIKRLWHYRCAVCGQVGSAPVLLRFRDWSGVPSWHSFK